MTTPTSLARPSRRQGQALMVWLAILLAGLGILVAIGLATPPPATALDPDSAKPMGAGALARVLEQHGVEVTVIRSIGAFERADVAGATVVLAQPAGLSPDNLGRVGDHVTGADRFVVVAADPVRLNALGVAAVARPHWATQPVSSGCSTGLARAEDTMSGGRWAYDVAPGTGVSGQGCFAGQSSLGYPLLTEQRGGRSETVLLGWSEEFDNAHITTESAAAVAVRVLGASPRLIWYQPGPGDLAAAAQAAEQGLQLPTWFAPLTWLLASGVAFLAVVQGRRLGAVVREPLPVTVRAVESTENLGSLYRRAGDPARAARTLQVATSERLRTRLGVDRAASTNALIEAVGAASGLPASTVETILRGSITDEKSLMKLAIDLTDLEKKVRMP
ncbi:MAG: DUF4350 domain-containing protein [Nostocoides sp.]